MVGKFLMHAPQYGTKDVSPSLMIWNERNETSSTTTAKKEPLNEEVVNFRNHRQHLPANSAETAC
jgi:hypothetical protein